MPYSCTDCAACPALKDSQGCTKPSMAAVWASIDDEWHSCPLLFCHPYLYLWHESYRYAEQFGAIDFGRQSSKWVDAMQWFVMKRNELQILAKRGDNGGR